MPLFAHGPALPGHCRPPPGAGQWAPAGKAELRTASSHTATRPVSRAIHGKNPIPRVTRPAGAIVPILFQAVATCSGQRDTRRLCGRELNGTAHAAGAVSRAIPTNQSKRARSQAIFSSGVDIQPPAGRRALLVRRRARLGRVRRTGSGTGLPPMAADASVRGTAGHGSGALVHQPDPGHHPIRSKLLAPTRQPPRLTGWAVTGHKLHHGQHRPAPAPGP